MQKDELSAKIIIAFLVIIIIFAGVAVLYGLNRELHINSFEECRDAGYPIIETYPEQCMTNENTFVNQTQIQ